jgi:hypothetical protein
MNTHQLLRAHKYDAAILECLRILEVKPDDPAAIGGMARALRAKAEYAESLAYFERLAIQRGRDEVANQMAPGSFPYNIDIACLHWILGDAAKAVQMMHGMASGILDGTVNYGDAAGGMTQGLLLYYMAISTNQSEEAAFALDYMRNRAKRSASRIWPGPIAKYYLGDITFERLLEVAYSRVNLAVKLEDWKIDLGKRRRTTVALFHDGVRSRARGDHLHCFARMRECCEIENPLLEQEWYLARHETVRAERVGVRSSH